MKSLAPSKRDLIAILPGTAHTITMEVIPVILHYNIYRSLSIKPTVILKKVPWCENLQCSTILLTCHLFDLEAGKVRQIRFKKCGPLQRDGCTYLFDCACALRGAL